MPKVKGEELQAQVNPQEGNATCQNCGFWGIGRNGSTGDWNVCRARTSVRVTIADSNTTARPVLRTHKDHYCSQWILGLA